MIMSACELDHKFIRIMRMLYIYVHCVIVQRMLCTNNIMYMHTSISSSSNLNACTCKDNHHYNTKSQDDSGNSCNT